MAVQTVARILVVDDNLQNRRLLEMALVSSGYSVGLAESGAEAIRQFDEATPDLVLLDLLMPGMDGFETCRRLRERKLGADVPIVFVTGLTDIGSHQKAMESGADDFLSKPVNRTELLVRVRSLLWIRKLKSELRMGYDLIKSQRDALLVAQQQREALTSLVVHDLKSPLTAILSNAEWLSESCQGEDAESARHIVTSALSMNRMVMNLLDISRSEDGMLVPRITRVDLEKLSSDVSRSQSRHDTGQKLEVESCKVHIDADADLLRRLLENLIDNAKKYSPRQQPIRVEIDQLDPAWIEIRVRDLGAGIPKEQRERIFDKYARLDSAGSVEHAVSSRGLGLTFCRLAAEVHGGKIWVGDNEPRGSIFHVRLPVAHEGLGGEPPAIA